MGGRLSVPRGPDGLTEAPASAPRPRQRFPYNINRRVSSSQQPHNRCRTRLTIYPLQTVLAPVFTVIFASLIYVYTRTTVAAAKENARRSREADGGSISWRREGMRRHGTLERPAHHTLLDQLKIDWNRWKGNGKQEQRQGRVGADQGEEKNIIEDGIRQARDRRARGVDILADKNEEE